MSKLDAKVFSSITPFAKQWILGEELMYEVLAENPQLLNDNYGIVDLGSLDWEVGYREGGFTVDDTIMQSLGIKQGLCNLYCSNFGVYLQNFQWSSFDNTPNNVIAKNAGNYVLYAKATDYTSEVDFKAAMQGVYLIYEKN